MDISTLVLLLHYQAICPQINTLNIILQILLQEYSSSLQSAVVMHLEGFKLHSYNLHDLALAQIIVEPDETQHEVCRRGTHG